METKRKIVEVGSIFAKKDFLPNDIVTTSDFDDKVLEHILGALYRNINNGLYFYGGIEIKYQTGDIHRIKRSFKKLGKLHIYLAKHAIIPDKLHISFISRKPKILNKKSFFVVDAKDTYSGEANKNLLVTLNDSKEKKDYTKIEIVFN